MNIGRKQAFAAIAAGLLGVLPRSRREARAAPPIAPITPPGAPPPANVDAATIEALRKRIAALEAALASQVAFTRDADGNLTLLASGNVTLKAASKLTLAAAGDVVVKGSAIHLN